MSALLVIGLLARGHAFQSIGVPFGCEHPAETVTERQTHGSLDDQDCPPDCQRCSCGQIPMMLTARASLPYALLEPYEIAVVVPPTSSGYSLHTRLERPPRALRAS